MSSSIAATGEVARRAGAAAADRRGPSPQACLRNSFAPAGEPRFLFGTQHLARKADAFDLANELGRVLGVANGGGRDDVGAPDFHMGEENLESLKRPERLGPRLAGKPARPLEAGAEA